MLGFIEVGLKILDKIIPDPVAKDKAKLALLESQQKGEFLELEKRYEAIVSESKSADPWTSRARPSFLYLFYFTVLMLTCVGPLIGISNPGAMASYFSNVGLGFQAIPEPMWWVFASGYLGYTTARTFEKTKRLTQ